MRILGIKNKQNSLFDQKSQKTTQITSKQHSRKNSFNFQSSNSSQMPEKTFRVYPFPNLIQKKRFMNITIKNKEFNQLNSEREIKEEKGNVILNFNFCKQASDIQNFYTKVMTLDQIDKELNKINYQQKCKKRNKLQSIVQNSTLTNLQSPIFKLLQLQQSSQSQKIKTQQFIIELENLMNQL